MVLQKNRSFWKRIRDKYRFSVLNENTFEEVFKMRLSRLNVFTALGVVVVFITIIVTSVIAYTPLREFIPGYPDGDMVKNIVENETMLDSINKQLNIKQRYLDNLKVILSGGDPEDYVNNNNNVDSTKSYKNIDFQKSKEDSILRKQIESDDKYLLSTNANKTIVSFDLDKMDFIAPIEGIITNDFNPIEKHSAIDIVSKVNSPIMSVLDGYIVFTGSTLEEGNVIYIQHKNNVLSVYKHLASVNVKQGEYVKRGQVIALLGNTGLITSGPHLHFELWSNGVAINPKDYINFE
jgi:murein DD-endopeptidase MepM/ murein hydrolase activator NlpD